MRTSEQILNFNSEIKSTYSIKQLDNLYTKIVYSNLDNGIVKVLKDMIELKAENIQLNGYVDN